MSLLFYAAVAIVTVNLFAAVVYYCLHRGAGLAISLVGTILIAMGFTFASLNDVPASKPAPDVTIGITTPPTATTTPEQPHAVRPSLDPSAVSRETPSPTAVPSKRPVHRHRFDDREKELQKEQRGTDPGAGGCDDAAAGGCK